MTTLGGITRRGRGPLSGEGRWALLFLAPTLIGLAVLSAGPILATLVISLTDWDLLTPPKLAGLDNYLSLSPTTVSQGTAQHVLLHDRVGPARPSAGPRRGHGAQCQGPGIAFIRTAYFLPVVTSSIAVALVWQWIYNPDSGLLNQVLGVIGLRHRSGSTIRPWQCRPSSPCRSGRGSA
jgi:multiple sugar transport system permease protein